MNPTDVNDQASAVEAEETLTRWIALDRLLDHPDNAMSDAMFRRLAAQIERSGRCPPLIVRPHPTHADCYELLDGHHRAKALRQLGWSAAPCDVWPVDDVEATELLLTLNRLRGDDNAKRRGVLLKRLSELCGAEARELAGRLPDDAKCITRLIATTQPPHVTRCGNSYRIVVRTSRLTIPPGRSRRARPASQSAWSRLPRTDRRSRTGL